MKNLLNNKGTNNQGTEDALNVLNFEAFLNGGITVEAKLKEGEYTGIIVDVIEVVKAENKYHQLVIKSDSRNIKYSCFDMDRTILEYNLGHNTQFKTSKELVGQPVTVYVYKVHEAFRFSILPVLPEGNHKATFAGLNVYGQTFVISFEYGRTIYFDIKPFDPEKQQSLLRTFSDLAKRLGYPEDTKVAFTQFNEKIGTEFSVNCTAPEGFKNRFINYWEIKETAEAEAAVTSIPKF